MPELAPIPLTLVLDDPELDREELEALTRTVQVQLRELTETIERQPVVMETYDDQGILRKGEGNAPGILKMEVNLENIKKVVSWLYQRLFGKPTKAKLSFGEGKDKVEFEFEGNTQKDLATTLEDVARFIERTQQLQQTQKP